MAVLLTGTDGDLPGPGVSIGVCASYDSVVRVVGFVDDAAGDFS